MAPYERSEPTHLLTITVPLNMEANKAAESWDIRDAMAEAVRVILPLIQIGTLGLVCDGPEVTITDRAARQEATG